VSGRLDHGRVNVQVITRVRSHSGLAYGGYRSVSPVTSSDINKTAMGIRSRTPAHKPVASQRRKIMIDRSESLVDSSVCPSLCPRRRSLS
jgi:hypothetical protein